MPYIALILAVFLAIGCSSHEPQGTTTPVVTPATELPLRAAVQRVTPAIVRLPQVALSSKGVSFSWDGRLFFSSLAAVNVRGTEIRVLRPQAIESDPDGRPRFDEDSFSSIAYFRFLESSNPELGAYPAVGAAGAMAYIPDPSFAENPFRSDAAGNPTVGGGASGYVTYAGYLYSNANVEITPGNPTGVAGRRYAYVTVSDPGLPSAKIHRAWTTTVWEPLRAVDGGYLVGAEITVVGNGRLLAMRARPPAGTGRSLLFGHILYSFNSSANSLTGWSVMKTLNHLYEDRSVLLAGRKLADWFPLARNPLRSADGLLIRSNDGSDPGFPGAYPWLSLDGTVLTTTTTYNATTDNIRRGGFAVVGQLTDWTVTNADGPINANRYGGVHDENFLHVLTGVASPGIFGDRWQPFRENGNDATFAIPYSRSQLVMPLISGSGRKYFEVELDDFDPDYIARLRMNELVFFDRGIKDWKRSTRRTPETSGNHLIGELLNGAAFPQEAIHDGRDTILGGTDVTGTPSPQLFPDWPFETPRLIENDCERFPQLCIAGRDHSIGIQGQAIYFPEGSAVRVPHNPTFASGDLTVELFVKPLATLSRNFAIAAQENRFALELSPTGKLSAFVIRAGGSKASIDFSNRIPTGEWTHVAFSYHRDGTLQAFIDGKQVGETKASALMASSPETALLIGPYATAQNGSSPVMILDEFRLSRVPRRAEEIHRHALRLRDNQSIPRKVTESPLVNLGRKLFSDPQLSVDRSISCASCHQPNRYFTDGRVKGRGRDNQNLQRNTPTVLNLAGLTRLGWDGSHESLEEQSSVPLFHPRELTIGEGELVTRLNADATYRRLFSETLNAAPSLSGALTALAEYQRSLISQDSPFDRFQQGNLNALPDAAKRGRALFFGKAFCFQCHTGPNFTDGRLHVTVADFSEEDRGGFDVSGRPSELHAFRTPPLRDVAETGPYFHDGSATTLRDVVRRYRNPSLNHPDPRILPLEITDAEENDLVEFLRQLTGTPTR